jgi:hypothetical protein
MFARKKKGPVMKGSEGRLQHISGGWAAARIQEAVHCAADSSCLRTACPGQRQQWRDRAPKNTVHVTKGLQLQSQGRKGFQ